MLVSGIAVFLGSAAAIPFLMGDGPSVTAEVRQLAEPLTTGSIVPAGVAKGDSVAPAAPRDEVVPRAAALAHLDSQALAALIADPERTKPGRRRP